MFKNKRKEIEESIGVKKVRKILPYKIPNGYFSWKDLSVFTGFCVDNFLSLNYFTPDETINLAIVHQANWFLKKSPIYLLYPEILEAFDNSKVIEKTEVLKPLNFPHNSFIILFPVTRLQNSDQTHLLSATVETFDFNAPSDFLGPNLNLNLYKTRGIIKSLSWVGFNNKEDIFACSLMYQRRWFSL